MPPRTCSISMRCAPGSTRCWRARGARRWPAPASIFCRIASCLISRAGRSKTSSRIEPRASEGRWGLFGADHFRMRAGDPAAMSEHPVTRPLTAAAAVRRDAWPTGRARPRSRCRPPRDAGRDRRARKAGRRRSTAPLRRRRSCARRCAGASSSPASARAGTSRRKIAATLASTGTPAQFVHPVEASHGDLGMIGVRGCDPRAVEFRRDRRARRHHRLFAALRHPADRDHRRRAVDARRGRRHRAAAAGRRRGLPDGARADHLDDDDDGARRRARASPCSSARAFRPPIFSVFHPGGRLGRRLLRVADIMHARRRNPAGRARRAHVRGDPGDDREKLRLRRRAATREGG